jgi:sporulation protein YlmC with PRC-barrel domain
MKVLRLKLDEDCEITIDGKNIKEESIEDSRNRFETRYSQFIVNDYTFDSKTKKLHILMFEPNGSNYILDISPISIDKDEFVFPDNQRFSLSKHIKLPFDFIKKFEDSIEELSWSVEVA